ncbi:Ig-like domain-containing protein [Vibrio sp. Vb339]|uniref:Ig-like domain-containing protein n=1 Tax=Vibrio sp. Vb339 TaxID=1192013 RepID=UPI001552F7E3|nr:Ig-like domain-containing protein [Vibrio sp. Vb339]
MMSKFFKGLLILVILPLLMLVTGCNSEKSAFSASSAKLESIQIAAVDLMAKNSGTGNLVVAVGGKQHFEAKGHYSDGSVRIINDLKISDWHTDNQDYGFFRGYEKDAGWLVGKQPGLITVTATKNGIISNTLHVDVTSAVITKIQVTPATVNLAKGQTQQLIAMATYSDSTSVDITKSVTWDLEDTTIATVTLSGLLSGIEEGVVALTVTKDGVVSNTANVNVTAAVITGIHVMPVTVNLAKEQEEQLIVTAMYSDGSSSNITKSTTWVSDNPSIVTVTHDGLLTGVKQGVATLTVTMDGFTSNTVNINVSSAVLASIDIAPSTFNMAKGQTQSITANGIYSDGSSSDITKSVFWSVEYNRQLGPMKVGENSLTATEVGTAEVYATKNNIISNAIIINITSAVITDIQVTHAAVNVPEGQTQQLTAIATYSDGTSSDVTKTVTWGSDDPVTATVTSTGLLAGVDAGSTVLTAIKDSIASNEVNVNVALTP